jgi:hypothetical protein
MFPDEINLADAGMRGGSRVFRLLSDFRCVTDRGVITVPAGFLTDGASIPRAFWPILNPYGSFFPAAILHDWGYSAGNDRFARDEVDEMFLDGMRWLGVPWITRATIYLTVRSFGWMHFKGVKL